MKKISVLLASTFLLISCGNRAEPIPSTSSPTSGDTTATPTSVDPTTDTSSTSPTSSSTSGEVQPTIVSIALSGTYKTIFYQNEKFDYAGLIVTATYDNGNKEVITDYEVSADTSKTGLVDVEVTSTKNKSVKTTYQINVIGKPSIYNEPYLSKQYYLNQVGDIYTAWNKYRGRGVTVAVIDSSFDAYHEDFTFSNGVSKVLSTSASFSYDGSKVTTQVGIDKVHDDKGDPHGTFCAGVVSAGTNSKGVVGIAPDSSLLLLRVDKKPKSICEAFKYAADNGAKVITISIGSYYDYEGDLIDDGSDLSTVFNDSITYARNKGVVICSAGGNGGYTNPTEYTFPGACANVIGAGGLAFNGDGTIWSGSSYNSSPDYQFIDVFAQSDKMFGCTNMGYAGDWEGTSFASPIIAGVAALYFEKNPNATPSQFETALFNNCLPVKGTGLSMDNFGYGRVHASKTLSEETTTSIDIRVKANSQVYLYAWNFAGTKEIASWPGVAMNAQLGTFTYSLDLNTYQNVIFSNTSGQTTNIEAFSFINNPTYDLTSPTLEGTYLVGSYK